MTTAEFATKFNRRNKVALCATMVCVGLIFLLGGSVRSAAGIGLLGIAFSWALSTNNRIVHWLFVISGLLLLVPPVGDGFLWPRKKPELIGLTSKFINDLRDDIKFYNSLIPQETLEEQRKTREEISKVSDELAKQDAELRSLQAEGVFRRVVETDWGTLLSGLLLLGAGIGLLVGVKPVRHKSADFTTLP